MVSVGPPQSFQTPAPPPSPNFPTSQTFPAPVCSMSSVNQRINDRLRDRCTGDTQQSMHEAAAKSRSFSPVHKTSPRRQVSPLDEETLETFGAPGRNLSRWSTADTLVSKPSNDRRTIPPTSYKQRKSSTSSQSTFGPRSPTSPPSRMSALRSAMHTRPDTQTKEVSSTQCRPSINGRHISSPVINSCSASPSPITSTLGSEPSKVHTWSGHYCPSRASPKPPKVEERSGFYDSTDEEEEEDGSSKRVILLTCQGRGRRFRRRLSETFGSLLCRS